MVERYSNWLLSTVVDSEISNASVVLKFSMDLTYWAMVWLMITTGRTAVDIVYTYGRWSALDSTAAT